MSMIHVLNTVPTRSVIKSDEFPNVPFPNMAAICIYVKGFQSTGSVLHNKRTHRKHE